MVQSHICMCLVFFSDMGNCVIYCPLEILGMYYSTLYHQLSIPDSCASYSRSCGSPGVVLSNPGLYFGCSGLTGKATGAAELEEGESFNLRPAGKHMPTKRQSWIHIRLTRSCRASLSKMEKTREKLRALTNMAMDQKPIPPVNIPISTKID